MKTDNNRPVSSIKHEDKRVAIPNSVHRARNKKVFNGGEVKRRLYHIAVQPGGKSRNFVF